MSEVTYYAVKPFVVARKAGRIVAGEAVQMPSHGAAMRRLRAIREGIVEGTIGAIAYSRTGDPDTGDWQDAMVLGHEGQVPPEELDPSYTPWD